MIRLDKYLAACGLGTRKEVKKIIRNGKVCVNGIVVKKDDLKIDELVDVVECDGERLNYTEFVYIMLNKPQGVISATTDTYDQTVIDLIDDYHKDIFPVGRLDKDTEGLLLITNDGQLAHELLSPKKHVEKEYYVEITNKLTNESIKQLETGIEIDEGLCLPAKVNIIDDNCLNMIIMEGKFHQVKKMIKACNSEVTYLKRVRMGEIIIDESLELGESRYLNDSEMEYLNKIKNGI